MLTISLLKEKEVWQAAEINFGGCITGAAEKVNFLFWRMLLDNCSFKPQGASD